MAKNAELIDRWRVSADYIQQLEDNEIFVFGSNEAGIHGAGAARLAKEKFGAVDGEGFGLFGQSFAIPTKDKNIQTISLRKIEKYVNQLIAVAHANPHLRFLVTEVGCGLAGYSVKDIAPIFADCIGYDNIYLPHSFWQYYSTSY